LKPSNIFLVENHTVVKIIDFGMAHLLTTDFTLSSLGMTGGTFHYMSPEQWRDPSTVDPRSDIYSLGLMLYEMLTQTLPMGRYSLPSQINPNVSPEIDRIVLKSLEPDPNARFQSMDEFLEQLEDAYAFTKSESWRISKTLEQSKLLDELGRFDEAINILDELERLYPDNADVLASLEKLRRYRVNPDRSQMIRIEDNYWIDKYPYPNIVGEYPVANVTWHEADAMCRKIGKRLCTLPEWRKACKGLHDFVYPYGNIYVPGTCNDNKPVFPRQYPWGLSKIGQYPKCISGYNVMEMSGHVWEWTSTEDSQGWHILAGGSWLQDPNGVTCDGISTDHTMYRYYHDGFRCCL